MNEVAMRLTWQRDWAFGTGPIDLRLGQGWNSAGLTMKAGIGQPKLGKTDRFHQKKVFTINN